MKKLAWIASAVTTLALAGVSSVEVIHETQHFRGDAASASFFAFDACVVTTAGVFGGTQVEARGGGPTTSVSAFYLRENRCTGESLFGWGEAEGGVSISRLKAAPLTVPMRFVRRHCTFDATTGGRCEEAELGTATLSVELRATGDIFRSNYVERTSAGGIRSMIQQVGASVAAGVEASLVLAGEDLLAGALSIGQLEDVSSGMREIERY